MSFLENITFKKVRPLLLPAFALFLIINANINRNPKKEFGYWPTSWESFKKTANYDPTKNTKRYKEWKSQVTIVFTKSLAEACKYEAIAREVMENYQYETRKVAKKSKWMISDYETPRYKKWRREVWDPLSTLEVRSEKLHHSSLVEVLRQAGFEDWKLYSRWDINGVGDLWEWYKENINSDKLSKELRNDLIEEKKKYDRYLNIDPYCAPFGFHEN